MVLKHKILLIVFIASIASAVVTGGLVTFLLKMVQESSLINAADSVSIAIAIGIYMLSGLFILVVLNVLLGKNVVIPAVERQMMDSERAMLTKQLHHSQKMEAVGRLAGSIAHDFNNLLTIIDGYSSLIVADPQSDEVEQNAHEVIEAARKASFITRKLLGFSRKEQAEAVLLDLNTTLEDTSKMLSRLIGEKIKLVSTPYAMPIYVESDPIQIGQVLMNLAVNARDAMPKGGRISIKIDRRQVGDRECKKPANLPVGLYAEISVHDTGFGIDPETLGCMFDAFFTTKKSDQGTGLGLSIVKSILEENSGFINVTSKVGAGTTFTIYLPVVEAKFEEPAVRNKVESPAPASQKNEGSPAGEEKAPLGNGKATILLVEDDPMICALVARTLEMNGYDVLVAEEGWEGIKIARNYKGVIDLLFTDVIMPGLGGVELSVAAQELYPDLKVLFMSGYARAQLVDEGVPSDAAVLEKPFKPNQVADVVAGLLA